MLHAIAPYLEQTLLVVNSSYPYMELLILSVIRTCPFLDTILTRSNDIIRSADGEGILQSRLDVAAADFLRPDLDTLPTGDSCFSDLVEGEHNTCSEARCGEPFAGQHAVEPLQLQLLHEAFAYGAHDFYDADLLLPPRTWLQRATVPPDNKLQPFGVNTIDHGSAGSCGAR